MGDLDFGDTGWFNSHTMTAVHYADVETSSDDYASRFAGPAGRWLLEVQAQIFVEQLSSVTRGLPEPVSLLDAGGGHAQIIEALAARGLLDRMKVTVLGSAAACRERIAPYLNSGRCAFEVGDLLSLPYPDHAFDVVSSFRFLPHCEQWNRHITELCRVARHAVIVDYPTSQSANCISPLLFGAKKKIERNTRTYTLFRHAEIIDAFQAAGFTIVRRQGEFFLPMVIHRVLKQPSLSALLEAPFRYSGLTSSLGSPVILSARRKELHG